MSDLRKQCDENRHLQTDNEILRQKLEAMHKKLSGSVTRTLPPKENADASQ